MTRYKVENFEITENDPSIQDRLKRAYANKARPLCLCRDPAPEMYIAKFEDRYLIKRMPGSGVKHSPDCDSYEPPPELSGLGQVLGSAIQEDVGEGITRIKLDFPLKKLPGRQAPTPSGAEHESVRTDGKKLTMRGLLHDLWEVSHLNRWTPNMEGKRSWYVIRKYLQQASESIHVGSDIPLAELLYIPESFNTDKKHEIEARRMGKMLPYVANHSAARKLMIVVGEVKEITTSRYGYKIIMKHLPNYHFMMNEDLYKRLVKTFELQLGLKQKYEESHLMVMGTFGIGHTEVATLEMLTMMNVTENWIPFESVYEKELIDLMTEKKRKFSKSLRYNLPSWQPLASMVSADTHPEPTAMFIHSGDDAVNQEFEEMIAQCDMPQWIWHISKGEMPALPVTGAVK